MRLLGTLALHVFLSLENESGDERLLLGTERHVTKNSLDRFYFKNFARNELLIYLYLAVKFLIT